MTSIAPKVLVGWTLLVWVGRVRNIVIDPDLTSGQKAPRLLLAGAFVALAFGVLAAPRLFPGALAAFTGALAAFTVIVWPVRGGQILLGDWELGFKVVHSVLATVSVALGLWVLATTRAGTTRAAATLRTAMGEPVTVVQSNTADPSRVRFETNRSFTGMGHERYAEGEAIHTSRPPDVLAGLLLDTGHVSDVHIYAQTVTVTLKNGHDADGLKEIIEDLYIHYKPGVPVPTEADFA